MNGYPYSQRPYGNRGSVPMVDMSGDQMNAFDLNHGQSLDDIVSSNEKDRRRMSMPSRFSAINFGDPNNAMEDFNFEMPTSAGLEGMMPSGTFPQASPQLQPAQTPANDLAITTQFSNANSPFSNMPQAASAYASPMHANLDMDMASPFPAMSLPLDMNGSLSVMPTDINLFPNTQFAAPVMSLQAQDRYISESSSATPDVRSTVPTRTNSGQDENSMRSDSRPKSEEQTFPKNDPSKMSLTSLKNNPPIALPAHHEVNTNAFNDMTIPWTTPAGGFSSTMNSTPPMNTQFKNAYSSTGFDMLGVLMRVATRADPQIDIGSVDLSCAFVVCDNELDDTPIVYCSENFERLTGYNKHMILGRNCRFLQSPDGKVKPGMKRTYVDDASIYCLKTAIEQRQEAQVSLINYRRGGQPFMNLLTMIPIPWEPGGPIKFIVGFQVDLVEQPSSMTNKNPDGSYRINYQRGMSMPSYVFTDHKAQSDQQQGQTISREEVSNLLSTYSNAGDSEITRRVWDKILLENTDDVVHVLSLKGLFLYLSPSSNRILEYDASELVGTALSSVCHPSDIVPVTRELKDMSNGSSVNVVFRIRRKKSGYMWFEGHGSLHTEQGKGRKCIILVGRERPVYTLSKQIVRASGGVGDNELWTKLSTSGMFLFVSSNVRSLLDLQPEDLVGSSIQALMRQESKQSFGRILELARSGRKGEVKHELINKRGQVLQAFTTIYPGDAIEGQKPTFLVAQTRLLKYSRNGTGQRPSMYGGKERTPGDTHASTGSLPPGMSPRPDSLSGAGNYTPHTASTDNRFISTEHHAITVAGQNGLQIGHQDQSLASEDNIFDELKTTRSSSWQYELRQMEKRNRYLAEEVQGLLAAKKKRKRRKGAGQSQKDCVNCHTKTTPEWRRGPSGNRDLCNSCGLRWAKQQGRVSPRTSSQHSATSEKSKKSASPRHTQTNLPSNYTEQGARPGVSTTLAQGHSYSHHQSTHDTHALKVPRMEVSASSQGYHGVPPKIEEVIEPD
ncbi:white collar-1 transcript variant 4 [Byssothecium circinans]|uniref:White collar-1 transcript variant 4 n=1 Tax=Byssothecium circinans TaxID=147558 RepID=A0A6A5U606_9PLEO|nr:white collar-1 transcript variant 4 [Byssothecium circinans]